MQGRNLARGPTKPPARPKRYEDFLFEGDAELQNVIQESHHKQQTQAGRVGRARNGKRASMPENNHEDKNHEVKAKQYKGKIGLIQSFKKLSLSTMSSRSTDNTEWQKARKRQSQPACFSQNRTAFSIRILEEQVFTWMLQLSQHLPFYLTSMRVMRETIYLSRRYCKVMIAVCLLILMHTQIISICLRSQH